MTTGLKQIHYDESESALDAFMPLALEVKTDEEDARQLLETLASIMHQLARWGLKLDAVSLLFDSQLLDNLEEKRVTEGSSVVDLTHAFHPKGGDVNDT